MDMEPQVVHSQFRNDSVSIRANDIDDGYFYDTPILTRCGVFEYHNPDGTVRRELRRPEDVFSPDSLKSYLGKPIIITHDAGAVTKENVKEHEVGTIISEGFAEGEYVKAKIVLHDPDSVKNSGYRELSVGYVADLIVQPGVYNGHAYDVIQSNIRVNHLALVAVARAGENARLNMDGSTQEGDNQIEDNKIIPTTNDSENEPAATVAGSEPEKASNTIDPVAFAAAMEAYIATHGFNPAAPVGKEVKQQGEPTAVVVASEPGIPPSNDGEETAEQDGGSSEQADPIASIITRRDAMEDCQAKSDINTLLAALEQAKADSCGDNPDMRMDSADMHGFVRDYVEALRIGDKLHLDGMDNLNLREAKEKIVSAVMPGMKLDGKDDAYINALYDASKESINRRKTTADQMAQIFRADGVVEKSKDDDPEAHRRRMIERQTNIKED